MKPLIKYRGGKYKELKTLIRHIPHFNGSYIEPFFGGGAMFFHLKPRMAIISDINRKLMDFYCGVRSNYDLLRAELDQIERRYTQNRTRFEELKRRTPHVKVPDKNEEMYYQLRDMFNDLTPKEYSDALLYFFINKTAYSGMIRYNSKGEFNVPYGRYPHLNTSLVTKEHSQLLSQAQIFHSDYHDIFKLAGKDDFMFLDPPYDCIFSDYGNIQYKEGFDEKDHRELAVHFKKLKCQALMVIGRTPLTEALYGDMIVGEYEKSYAVNIRNRFKSSATHILISNYGNVLKEHFPELAFENEMAL